MSFSITSATVVHRGAAMDAVRRCSDAAAAAGGLPHGKPGHRAAPPDRPDRLRPTGGGSRVRTELRARLARKVNVFVPSTRATSLGRSFLSY